MSASETDSKAEALQVGIRGVSSYMCLNLKESSYYRHAVRHDSQATGKKGIGEQAVKQNKVPFNVYLQ